MATINIFVIYYAGMALGFQMEDTIQFTFTTHIAEMRRYTNTYLGEDEIGGITIEFSFLNS